jgi:hypothetical protein
MPDALTRLADALTAAGFEGVERDGAVLYARADGDGAAEFTATGDGPIRLAMRFAVRAPDAERQAWMRANPKGRLEIAAGETELSLVIPEGSDDAILAALLADWRALLHAGAVAAVGWRRGLRPLEGM